jgi:glyoxylase-like metal-dependent hydrolase (beta-lactamase superfamily II)
MPADVFPQLLAGGVYRLGYNDNETAGAHAFFMRTRTGLNVMIDGPRFVPKLVAFFEQQGGLDHVLLTHRDDVGASAKYAEHFGARLWIHELDRSASPEASDILTGFAITEPVAGVTVIPIPGHTIGSVAFLIDENLFVGDSLSWELDRQQLWTNALRCWDDWDMQRRSLARLRNLRFTHMLAGHGGSIALPHERMQAELATCLAGLVDTTWQPLTHFPNGQAIPDEWKQLWADVVPGVKADFFAAMSDGAP